MKESEVMEVLLKAFAYAGLAFSVVGIMFVYFMTPKTHKEEIEAIIFALLLIIPILSLSISVLFLLGEKTDPQNSLNFSPISNQNLSNPEPLNPLPNLYQNGEMVL